MKKNTMRSLLYSGPLLGVDLGSHTVKVLHLRRSGRRAAVVAASEREVWRELAEAKTAMEKREVYVRALQALGGSKWRGAKNAALSLPGASTVIRFLDVTNRRRMDSATGLPEDAVAMIPYEPGEAEVSARTRPGGAGGEELMLVAARRSEISDAASILRAAGLVPAVVVNDALAAADAASFFREERKAPFVLVNIGASVTTVAVMDGGICRAARVLNVAGGTMTRAVRREFGVEAAAAEDLKRRLGLATSGADGERARKALRPTVRDLCVEVRRTIDAFLDKRPHDAAPVSAVLISGGGAAMGGLAESMSVELGTAVEVFRPLSHAHVARTVSSFDKSSPGLCVAAGLSLNNAVHASAPEGRVNLLPSGAWREAVVRQASSRAVLATAVGALVLGFVGSEVLYYRHRALNDEQARFENKLAQARYAWAHRPRKKSSGAAKAAASPYSYLKSLQVNGVFGGGSFVMLAGGDRVFALRNGRLYDEDEKPLAGVTARTTRGAVELTTDRGDHFQIAMPK